MKKTRPKSKIEQPCDRQQPDSNRIIMMGAFPGGSIIPMVHIIDELDSEEGRDVIDYIEAHSLLPPHPHKLPVDFICSLANKLRTVATIEEKKGILILLAHHGSLEALDILTAYQDEAEPILKGWIRLAVDECRTFLTYSPHEFEGIHLEADNSEDPQELPV